MRLGTKALVAVATTAFMLLAPRVARADGGYLGVYLVDESESKDGALVEDVADGSPAAKAGIKKNDLIVGWDGEAIANSKALIERLLKASPGEKHKLRLAREGWERDLEVGFGKREGVPDRKPEGERAEEKKDGDGERGFLGVRLKQNPEGPGAVVDTIEKDSPAEKGGLKKGDVVVAADGKKIDEYTALIEVIRGAKPGQKIKMRVARDGWERDVEVTLGSRPAERAAPPPLTKPAERPETTAPAKKKPAFLGVALVDSEGKGPCVIDEVQAGSPAEKSGLKTGDVIVSIGDKPVKVIADFEAALKDRFAGEEIVVHVEREGWKRQVKVVLGDRPGE